MAAQKKKINKADYEFRQREGEELVKRPGEIDGMAFRMMDLKDCTVSLYDHIAQVSIVYKFRSQSTGVRILLSSLVPSSNQSSSEIARTAQSMLLVVNSDAET